MRKEYVNNKKIAIYGTAKAIAEAETVLNTLDGLEPEMLGYRLHNEETIRLKIQDAIDTHNIKAVILVDGNTVYPYVKTIKQYDQLKKSGTLGKMSDYFYNFLHQNFDIAHYDKHGYIWHYDNDFITMKKAVLDNASTPGWYSDVRRILNYIQGLSVSRTA